MQGTTAHAYSQSSDQRPLLFSRHATFPLWRLMEKAFDVSVLQRLSPIKEAAVGPLRAAMRTAYYYSVKIPTRMEKILSVEPSLSMTLRGTIIDHYTEKSQTDHMLYFVHYIFRANLLMFNLSSSYVFIKLKQKHPCILLETSTS
jgi:hypothetical protein